MVPVSLSAVINLGIFSVSGRGLILVSLPRSRDDDGLGAPCPRDVQLSLHSDDLCVQDREAGMVSRGS